MRAVAVLVLALLGADPRLLAGQDFQSIDRDRGLMMVRGVRRYIKDVYYDTTFRGIDLDARVRAAETQIRQATSNTEIFSIIAQLTLEFNDSHTFFVPPPRAARVEYGWQMTAIGDSVYLSAVKPGSDAAAQGLRPGDRLVAINGIPMSRRFVWQARYYFDLVSPRSQLTLSLDRTDTGPMQVDVRSEVVPEPRHQNLTTEGFRALILDWENFRRRARNQEWVADGDVFIWHLATFMQDNREIDRVLARARQHRAVVLDLRDNGGGSRHAVVRLVSRLFERRVLAMVDHRRRDVDSVWAESGGLLGPPFLGPLVVVVNSASASAAEILARIVQLERRGTVVGDRTMGAVMGARQFGEITSEVRSVLYGVSVTSVDVRMADGASLEHVGVTPDERLVPTPADLATRRDPVLARAVELAGGRLTPVDAGRLFPVEWP